MSGTSYFELSHEFAVSYYDQPAEPEVGIFHASIEIECVEFRGIDVTDKFTGKEMDELADMVTVDLQQAAEDARDSEADGRYQERKDREL